MRTVRISDEVWQEIAKRGQFGETEDDVLRRVFQIKSSVGNGAIQPQPARAKPGNALHHKWDGSRVTFRFDGGGHEESFELPRDKSNKLAIRQALDSALDFGKRNGASEGQLLAIRKAFTDWGYHLTK